LGTEFFTQSLPLPVLTRFFEDGVIRIDIDAQGSLVQVHFFNGLLSCWFQYYAALAVARYDVER